MSENQPALLAKIEALESLLTLTSHTFEKKLADIQSELQVLRVSISEEQVDSKVIAPVSKSPDPVLNANSDQFDNRLNAPSADKAKAEWIEKLAHQVVADDSVRTLNQSTSVDNTQESEAVFQPNSIDKPQIHEEIFETSPKPGLINALFASIIHFLIEFVLTRLTFFSAPFQELYHRFIKLYHHYQQQGKAPVFLMTVKR
jgi:hypothetical protein